MQALKHFLLALQFFTRIPVRGRLADWVGYSPAMLRASTAHFPAVGLLVGSVAAGVYGLLALYLPAAVGATLVAAVLSTTATILLTGALHEDGLADLADGLGGGQTRERALEIMKDSRTGAFGVLAIALALLSKIALLALLGQVSFTAALLTLALSHVASRSWPLLTMRSLPYLGSATTSKARPLVEQMAAGTVFSGLAWLVLACVAVFWLAGNLPAHWLGGLHSTAHLPWLMLTALCASALGWMLVHWRLWRRLGGFTGDGLGAIQQVSEIGFLLGAVLYLGAR